MVKKPSGDLPAPPYLWKDPEPRLMFETTTQYTTFNIPYFSGCLGSRSDLRVPKFSAEPWSQKMFSQCPSRDQYFDVPGSERIKG